MPDDVKIRITGDESDAEQALESVEKAMRSVQAQAQRVTGSTHNLIPVNKLNEGKVAVQNIDTSLFDLLGVVDATGTQTTALAAALRASTIAGGTFSGSVKTISASLKAMLVSLGPIGIAIIAIGAAWMAVSAILDHNKKKLEEQKKALEDYQKAAKALEETIADMDVSILRSEGKNKEADIAALEIAEKKELDKAYELYRQQMDAAEKAGKSIQEIEERYSIALEKIITVRNQRRLEIDKQYEEESIKATQEARQKRRAFQEELDSQRRTVEDLKFEAESYGMSPEEKRLAEIERNKQREIEAYYRANRVMLISEKEFNEGLAAINQKYDNLISEPQRNRLKTIEEMTEAIQAEIAAIQAGGDALLAYSLGLKEAKTEEEKAAQAAAMTAQKRLNALQEQKNVQENYLKTVKRLNHEIAMAYAKRVGDEERMRELRKKRLMDEAKLTAKQAENQIQLEEELANAIRERQRISMASFESADTMYRRIAEAALMPAQEVARMNQAGGGGGGARTTTPSPQNQTNENIRNSTETLNKIYSIMLEIKHELPLIGAAG